MDFLNPQNILDQIEIAPGMKVSDFGSGSGDFAILVAKVVGQEGVVNAFDVQESAISSLRSKARLDGLTNINLHRANLEIAGSTKLSDGSQDMVLLTNILFQVDVKENVFKEAFRVLRKGGVMVMVDWKKEAPLGPSRERRLDRFHLIQLAESVGFKMQRELNAGAYHFGLLFEK